MMSNRDLAKMMWKKYGALLLDIYCLAAIIHYALIGPIDARMVECTNLGAYGGSTYIVANVLFYLGNTILVLRGVLAISPWVIGLVEGGVDEQ